MGFLKAARTLDGRFRSDVLSGGFSYLFVETSSKPMQVLNQKKRGQPEFMTFPLQVEHASSTALEGQTLCWTCDESGEIQTNMINMMKGRFLDTGRIHWIKSQLPLHLRCSWILTGPIHANPGNQESCEHRCPFRVLVSKKIAWWAKKSEPTHGNQVK